MYIYKLLRQSISFSNAKAKNLDIYYGGKLGEINIWVNNYSVSQSIYMINDYNFSAIINNSVDYKIVDNKDVDIVYNTEFINQSDSDSAIINLTEY